MEEFQTFDTALLDNAGLNRLAVIDIGGLPKPTGESIRASCPTIESYRQLILIGHAGRALWESIRLSPVDSEHPVDDFTIQTVNRWFAEYLPQNVYEIVFPGCDRIGLQALGQLVGWHHPSPFGMGIDPEWGSWYAYRAVVLADTAFEPTRPAATESPCRQCLHRSCVAGCPAAAMETGRMEPGKCIAYRKQPGSRCRETCLARLACPVGGKHRYCDDQIRHTYSISMAVIERLY